MVDLDIIKHHPAIEDITDVLCNRTQNQDRGFFRVEAAYFLAKMAATMRAVIKTKDRGDIPVNLYALALATSGFGKGHSVNIIETQFLGEFRKIFMEDTFNILSQQNLFKLAMERAVLSGLPEEDEKDKLDKEFSQAGAYPFTFDSGTGPAVKQLRHKLLLSSCGAINLQIDEIGSNLVGNTEVLNVYLELYDQGMVKAKLTKNTNENQRGEDIDGKTPANMLLFGTPSKLLDGGKTEEEFYSFLDTGYARRCLFGWGQHSPSDDILTPVEIYTKLIDPKNNLTIGNWSNHFAGLADPTKFEWEMHIKDDVGIELLTYKINCEKQAEQMAEHEEIRKNEISHRYFKVLKLAGTYAFIDESNYITMDHIYSAMKLVEESGHSFQRLMTREKTYVKLAKYVAANKDKELTHADLYEALPYYRSGNAARNEMMTLARAWGIKHHIVIKKSFLDGIEFFSGETLELTDLEKISVSYSDHFAYNYLHEKVPFHQLHKLTCAKNTHWCNHAFKNDHRASENVIPGFNLLVIDIDGTIPLVKAHELLKEYVFMTCTTKRHSDKSNRFRILIPISYELPLDKEEYTEFMTNILKWLPFETDPASKQISKKWETFHKGIYHYNLDGQILDPLRFVPKTSKNEIFQQSNSELQSLDSLERWFAERIVNGNRNDQLIKFALFLVDTGLAFSEVENKVKAFNSRLPNGLSNNELQSTILQTVAKKISEK